MEEYEYTFSVNIEATEEGGYIAHVPGPSGLPYARRQTR
jgi:predicted RNase H-like HicB family nuclease